MPQRKTDLTYEEILHGAEAAVAAQDWSSAIELVKVVHDALPEHQPRLATRVYSLLERAAARTGPESCVTRTFDSSTR
jgi:hypothetical protein